MRGRWIALSIPRRIVADLMYFSAGVPLITVQRELNVAGAAEARGRHAEKPTWTAVFAKAYAVVAAEFPELRRAYVRLPWPHLHEYDQSAASVVVERDYDGELGVAVVHVKDPESFSIAELGRMIRAGKGDEMKGVKFFQDMVRIAGLPLPVRRVLWWIALNVPRMRGHYFGTFLITTVSALDTGIMQPRSPLATALTYDRIGGDGRVTVRCIFDHRVMDAMTAARALGRLEQVLNGAVADELRGGA